MKSPSINRRKATRPKTSRLGSEGGSINVAYGNIEDLLDSQVTYNAVDKIRDAFDHFDFEKDEKDQAIYTRIVTDKMSSGVTLVDD